MNRKEFIQKATWAGISFSFLGAAQPAPDAGCTLTPSETEGPFPTHKPGDMVFQNIIGDRKGTALDIQIFVYNINNQCKAFANARVDIWHCDSQGEYSEYGGTEGGMMPPPPDGGFPPFGNGNFPLPPMPDSSGHIPPPPMMSMADHTKEHFLRGRQIADKKGKVVFKSIFPGWYPGRAPHVHVHIFGATGKSLLVTQIAFPENVTAKVYDQGAYKCHGLPDTHNANDNVFSDSIANELGEVSGNTKDGFVLSHSIYVKG